MSNESVSDLVLEVTFSVATEVAMSNESVSEATADLVAITESVMSNESEVMRSWW